MSYEKLMEEIKKILPFQEIEFQAFCEKASIVHLKKQEVWEREGAIGRCMGFVNKGVLRQFYIKNGDEYIEHLFYERDFIGHYMSYLQQIPSTTSTQALENCELIVLPFNDLQQLYQKHSNIEKFARFIGDKKLFDLQARSTSFLLDSPEERYYKLLDQHPAIHARLPQYYIAQYLGIKPESLSRIRKRHRS